MPEPVAPEPTLTPAAAADTRFFGHPRGLSTLFFTELWERFSYYGTRAILVLFMTAPAATGGLAYDAATASTIYGLYTSLAYLLGLPGGWLADRFLGQRRAVLWGGVLIAFGNLSLAVPSLAAFYAGLTLIVLGTGLLKPNVSAMVGQLYAPDDARRDAGFSLFYVGINLGAFLSPLVCGYLGENVNWHYGFLVAGLGMLVGVGQYLAEGRHLGEAGLRPAPFADKADAERQRGMLRLGLAVLGGIVVLVGGLLAAGALTLEAIVSGFSVVLLVIVVGTFVWLFRQGDWTPEERRRLVVVVGLFLAAVLFWSAFEQAGSSLNLFAEERTDRTAPGWFAAAVRGTPAASVLDNGEYPASFFQSLNSLFLFPLAPLFAWLWIRLGPRNPASPAKFAGGLVFAGLGFLTLVPAAALAQQGVRVSALWLCLTYLLHTIGELLLSPVGLSAMTKLAPLRVAGLMMGIWFLATSVGSFVGGTVASYYEALPLPTLFGLVAAFSIGAGLVMALCARPLQRLMGGVR